MSINIDGRDCCQTGQFSQDVTDGALTHMERDVSAVTEG
ncbi:general secretion pathway protein GspL [Shigella flexneri]|nr:general secretion pathway protein GspL [Shigella flexneri]EHF3758950.1 general secretion pathway protein GspL [Escherichia coli]EAA1748956.1 general secretion pathway protein GspL [Shigella flexneri]EFX1872055.1 general secretion pathway protein GspL [Shigella flexneri]EFX2101409.1 general secretion pathway protein GspL [Shigella flexneri]